MPCSLVVSGMGVVSAIGQGKRAFLDALLAGEHAFAVMQRPGRQRASAFIGAEIPSLTSAAGVPAQLLRAASLSTRAALPVILEAWDEARLSQVDPFRIGLIVGGSNFQQRESVQLHEKYHERSRFVTPAYALSFMDTDLCGICTQQFGIRGFAYTLGGASASGQLAIIQAALAVLGGRVDVCIAVGALTDLSFWECRALHSLGAMGTDRYATQPALACRPFDRDRDGFIFGESCGAVVIESAEFAARRGSSVYAALAGWGLTMDANRNPDPSLEGEMRTIRDALSSASWSPTEVQYVNPHGTGSVIGDEIELRALRECGLTTAYLNATKSLIGHGMCAAGTVEVVATLLQMRASRLHPTRNLDHPVDPGRNWTGARAVEARVDRALTLSMGFGGINTALCWQRAE